MAIPETGREAMLTALAQFDRGERSPRWHEGKTGWMSKRSYGYAIVHGGRRYPVKEIIRLAIRVTGGDWMVSFSGGKAEANRYVGKYGFEVEPIETGAG